ncbi:MAG TPA: hypothetical protein VJQ57_09510 [Acidimicrobiia bacterium]|nr:hypothetical protein [Acidimicrobiia bacterium]
MIDQAIPVTVHYVDGSSDEFEVQSTPWKYKDFLVLEPVDSLKLKYIMLDAVESFDIPKGYR